ncbi:MAG: hypothetical protein Kow0092_19470 [Deferrisomatales bacterium]
MAAALRRPDPRAPGPAEALTVLAVLVGVELALAWAVSPPAGRLPALWRTGALRLAETGGLFAYWRRRGRPLAHLGLTGATARRGVVVGAGLAASLGAAAGLAEGIGRWAAGASLLAHLAGPRLPSGELLALLAVGGVVGPAFEELLFRGILYGALRTRWGPAASTAAVTALFAAAHAGSAPVPWVQAVGGVVFCVAYERSGSLWAPWIVHATGNGALFLLPCVLAG